MKNRDDVDSLFAGRHLWRAALVLGWWGLIHPALAQQPPPPPPPPPAHERHARPHPPPPPPSPHPAAQIPNLRQRLERLRPVNKQAEAAMQLSRYFLERAQTAEKAREPFLADRYAGAADAQIHIAERQQPGNTEPMPPSLPPEAIANHLERAYFRLQQAGYFESQSQDEHVKDLPQRGRRFYENAVQAYDKGDYVRAEQDIKCVDDTVRTLEELAQAASPLPPPAPPPPPPRPGRR